MGNLPTTKPGCLNSAAMGAARLVRSGIEMRNRFANL